MIELIYLVVVALYLVTDRSSSPASSGSLVVSLYGDDQVMLKAVEFSSEILKKKISKITLPLDNEAVVKYVKVKFVRFEEMLISTILTIMKIEAAARISLRIFEVQTAVNELPPTIFSPPTPGSITFVGNEDTTGTGIVSLWFVPVTKYVDG